MPTFTFYTIIGTLFPSFRFQSFGFCSGFVLMDSFQCLSCLMLITKTNFTCLGAGTRFFLMLPYYPFREPVRGVIIRGGSCFFPRHKNLLLPSVLIYIGVRTFENKQKHFCCIVSNRNTLNMYSTAGNM